MAGPEHPQTYMFGHATISLVPSEIRLWHKRLRQAREYFRTPQRKLFLMSLLMMLVLAFIVRLAGEQLHIMGYMQYAVLAGALFGIALGWRQLAETSSAGDVNASLSYLVLLTAFLCAFRFSLLGDLAIFPDADTYFGALQVLAHEPLHELIATAALIAVMHLSLRCFMFAARALSAVVGAIAPLDACRCALSAGVVCLVVSALISVSGLSPAIWAGLILVLAVAASRVTRRQLVLAALAAGVAAALAAARPIELGSGKRVVPDPTWTRIHERAVVPLLSGATSKSFALFTDGRLDQVALDPAMPSRDWHRLQQTYDKLDLRDAAPDFYNLPFQVWPNPQKILVLGAGTGNHVAACLSHGASSVEAVEADPYVLRLGFGHPARPYEDPRVTTYCQDPRTFLTGNPKTYDLIIVAAHEGREAASPFSPMRPSGFLYTAEAFKLMRDRLSDQGYLVVASPMYERWFMLRVIRNMIQVFEMADGGVLTTAGQCVFSSRNHPRDLQKTLAMVRGAIVSPDTIELNKDSLGAAPILDGSPFPFTGLRTIPLSYLWCMYVLIAVMLVNLGPAQTPLPPVRHLIGCGAWAMTLTLSLACLIMQTTRALGSSIDVTAWCLAAGCLLGIASGAVVKKLPALQARQVCGAAALILVACALASGSPAEFALPVAVMQALPVFVSWIGISVLLAMDLERNLSRSLMVGGAAIGLLVTNLSFLVGTFGLCLIATLVLLAGQLLPWELIVPADSRNGLAKAGAGN